MLATPVGMILDMPRPNFKVIMLRFSIDEKGENEKSHDEDSGGCLPIFVGHILESTLKRLYITRIVDYCKQINIIKIREESTCSLVSRTTEGERLRSCKSVFLNSKALFLSY